MHGDRAVGVVVNRFSPDGTQRELPVYVIAVLIDGVVQEIEVSEMDCEPLPGMELFAGFHVTIDVVPNGRVTFEQITSIV